jgi:hypothetical protein
MGDPMVDSTVNLLGNVLGEFVAHLIEVFGRSRLNRRFPGKTVPRTGLVIRDRRLAGGLHVLPQDLPLRRLTTDNLPEDRNLRGVERWPELEHVGFCGAPGDDEIRALSELPRLRRITISRSSGAESLAPLRAALPAVEVSPITAY